MKKWTIFFSLICSLTVKAQIFSSKPTNWDLVGKPIYVSDSEPTVVKKAAELLSEDIERVSGKKSPVVHQKPEKDFVWIGTVSENLHSILGKDVPKKWEEYLIKFDAQKRVLVISGADRRGTAYGALTLSREMGVSPWYWWADVPVKRKSNLYINANLQIQDAPVVQYRGIFINDEAPALSSWSKEKFGGFNHQFYSKVFELMLRLKSNYIWPAMWGNAFYDDDPKNIQIADDFAIVIGTSHHEPLHRAHDEWRRYGKGPWNFVQNPDALKEFWKTGMKRSWNENITTIGMRGDGDEPMSRETATELLENIVAQQRQIIEEVTGKPASETPQLWALYKEVQDYYDKGMRVPDDVTLLLCDDNWGNLRKLPTLNASPRKGGYGIYYHFDYVGGPRNYKWLNTTQIMRVWEQMNLAYEHGVEKIWIVNVGDIKPMEFPISFWCDMAWNPEKMSLENAIKYPILWAEEQFGKSHAAEIGDILQRYTQYNHRRTPELLDAKTYSLENYQEWEKVHADYQKLKARAEKIKLPAEVYSAYFQLVLHPVKAMANLYDLYYQVALNHQAHSKSYSTTADYAEKAKKAFEKDSLITLEYHQLNGGKWNHMMSQTHIGYRIWQQPPYNIMPMVYTQNGTVKPEPISKHTPQKAVIHKREKYHQFIEVDGYISIQASNFSKSNGNQWKIIPELGKHGAGVSTYPTTLPASTPGGDSPYLEYEIHTYSSGPVTLTCSFAPSLNYHFTEDGLQYAISVDEEAPQVISLNKEDKDSISGIWNKWVAEAEIKKTSTHQIDKPGKHVIKFWRVNAGVVLQKITADFGGLKPSYLGPPETKP